MQTARRVTRFRPASRSEVAYIMPPMPPMSGMPPPPPPRLLLRLVGDHGFGGDQQTSDRGRVLQRGADNLGRVDDAELEHVAILFGLRVEAEAGSFASQHLARNNRAVDAGVLGDLTQRRFERLAHDRDAGVLVGVVALQAFERFEPWTRATPPPTTMPSSTAARVAFSASSTRSLRSFTSTSVQPPTRMTATPPASLARRSCSFSRS